MSYLGSKAATGLYQAIIALMPPHDIYVEPFLGSGQIYRRKPAATKSYLLDIDQACIDAATYADSSTSAQCENAFDFLATFPFTESVLVYCDPPYMHSTRTSKKRYRHEFSDADHVRLLNTLSALPSKIILSTYPNKLYETMLPAWRYVDLRVMTRGGVRTERIYYNYDLTAVHYPKYIGKNFTDRQRIKRKADRWALNFARLSAGERAAILRAILRVSSDIT